ncbi:MAG: hypothetical protein K1X57_16785 [Gemmataceae bacterium]|nr:hypothetical protein [Gemmataceae bacterium]
MIRGAWLILAFLIAGRLMMPAGLCCCHAFQADHDDDHHTCFCEVGDDRTPDSPTVEVPLPDPGFALLLLPDSKIDFVPRSDEARHSAFDSAIFLRHCAFLN